MALENELKLDALYKSQIQRFLNRRDHTGRPIGTRFLVELVDEQLEAKIFVTQAVEGASDLGAVYLKCIRHLDLKTALTFYGQQHRSKGGSE